MTESNSLRWWTLILFVILSGLVIALGQAFAPGEWYESLKKPAIAPPNWIFGVVWTPLYMMIAAAGWFLWERARSSSAMKWWFLQLTLNAAWSWVFFDLQAIGAALVEILLLWAAIGATIVTARRVAPIAAWLLAPYWVWVTFATILNFAFWNLGR